MQRCKNSECNKLIKTRDGDHVSKDVFGHDEHWCDEKCYGSWMRQNLVFIESTDPFARRKRTHSEHRRKHY